HDLRDEESGCGVEQFYPRLAVHIRQVTEIPRHQIINLMKRGERDVQRVAQVFPLKDAASDVTVGQYRGLLRDLQLRQVADQLQIAAPVRLTRAFEFPRDQRRNISAVGLQFVLPPSDRQVPAERLAFFAVRADDRCFEVDAGDHKSAGSGEWGKDASPFPTPHSPLPAPYCFSAATVIAALCGVSLNW